MVQKLTEDVVIRESQGNNTTSWSEHVVAEDARLPFGVILSEQHIDSGRYITVVTCMCAGVFGLILTS